jgi:hypothetical protein
MYELSLYKTNVKSPAENLNRSDVILMSDLTLLGGYESRHYDSELKALLSNQKYSNFTQSDVNFSDFEWKNTFTFLDENLTVTSKTQRERELFNSVQGGFADRVYQVGNNAVSINQDFALSYFFPKNFPLNGSIIYSDQNQFLEYDDEVDELKSPGEYRSKALNFRVGQYSTGENLYWSIDGSRYDNQRVQGKSFLVSNMSTIFKIPAYSSFYLIMSGNYTDYKNNESGAVPVGEGEDVAFNDNVNSENRTAGTGVAWVKKHDSASFQITREWDFKRGDKYWAGDIRWPVSKRLYINLDLTRKIYGDSKALFISYQGKRSVVQVRYDDNVQLQYISDPQSVIEGIYICDTSNSDFFNFDDELCRLPSSLNTQILPNESVITKLETIFPLSTRVTLNQTFGIDWDFEGDKWTHEIYVRSSKQVDLEFKNGNNSIEGFFQGDQRLNTLSFLRFTWRFRQFTFDSVEARSIDRVYSMGYHRDINTRADWAITYQHINRENNDNTYSYNDNRLFFTYTHRFGNKNKEIRSFFSK